MANTFKRYKVEGVTTETVITTAQEGTEITVIGMTVANVGTSEASISLKHGTTHMLKNAPILVGSAMVPIGGEQKVVLEAGDTFSVTSDVAVDVILSVLEKS